MFIAEDRVTPCETCLRALRTQMSRHLCSVDRLYRRCRDTCFISRFLVHHPTRDAADLWRVAVAQLRETSPTHVRRRRRLGVKVRVRNSSKHAVVQLHGSCHALQHGVTVVQAEMQRKGLTLHKMRSDRHDSRSYESNEIH